jgi:hypothetical protein
MFTPGYYKTNYRALRFRELVRMHGLLPAFSGYLVTRFKRPDSAGWMPSLWADTECRREDLSEEFWLATKVHRLSFERLGYSECGFRKSTNHLNPMAHDNGSITYLDPARRHVGNLSYVRLRIPSTSAEVIHITIAFTAAFEQGYLSCTNSNKRFDPPSENEVIQVDSYDVNFIHQQFQNHLQQRKEVPRAFPDQESLRQSYDARHLAAFEERARRRLYIPMTEQEVVAAKARVAKAASGIFSPPQRKFRLEFLPLIIVLIFGLQFICSHPGQTGDNTIDYRGEHFKMRKVYSTYEDYKDDPNNLDTNELDRIEHAMTSAKIPSSFKDRDTWIKLVFDLRFPGYGMGSESVQTDDGSVVEVESVEIPQRNKDRNIVVRESHGGWNLVDDFVFGTGTNKIQRVKLENQTLRYYDDTGNMLREKHL